MIVTVTPSSKLSLTAASAVQGNSAPQLTFQVNSLYVSFNHNKQITITAGTYSSLIPITTSTNASFLSNVNIELQSTGFTFEPTTVFLPLGQKEGYFRIGADESIVPVVYFYQGIKQEEVNTNYQITLNMNIKVTNTPVPITIPSSLTLPQGGCTTPILIMPSYPPFTDFTLSFTFDNDVYSETDLYPNPITTPSQLTFNSTHYNQTFSFCSSSTLALGDIPLELQLAGTNYESYAFSPSSTITLNVVSSVTNNTPTLALTLSNQQKTFLDINFTNNVDGIIFYQMAIGDSPAMETLENMQVLTKSNSWSLASPIDFFTRIYTVDRDSRIAQFYQNASTSTIRIDNLHSESPYKLCGYLINMFGVVSDISCLSLNTMSWGTVHKARLSFTKTVDSQELNNILCFFTAIAGTHQMYLLDAEGSSCGNRVPVNSYYSYKGSKFIT